MNYVEIIRQYVEIILNWPFLGAVVVIYFLKTFQEEIKNILKSKQIKIGNTEFTQGQLENTTASLSIESRDHNWEYMFYQKAVAENTRQSLF